MSITLTPNPTCSRRTGETEYEVRLGGVDKLWDGTVTGDDRPGIIQEPAIVARVRQGMQSLIEEMDADERPPTAAAKLASLALLTSLGNWYSLSPGLSHPRVSSAGDGDLILEWQREERKVILFVLPSGTTRLQQVTGTGAAARASDAGRNPGVAVLAGALNWLEQP